jgi:L-seryl-tRNA(Ser) seleniumtransferase
MAATDGSVVHGSKARPQDLPSMDKLLRLPAVQPLLEAHGHTLVATQARSLLDALRAQAVAGTLDSAEATLASLAAALDMRVTGRMAPRLRRVLNLTGTVIHTNLGRSVLPASAVAHLAAMMQGPNNLEYDLASGSRGDRDSIVEGLLCEITGAEAATVVNNNAAAVLLTIAALAGGREVIISRGELVEIGGAFRMPDVMASAGATMVEVGTTNRTHLTDYERAITPQTSLLMKVHTSNYAVQGFTSAVPEAELAVLAAARGVALATDLGSGSLIDMSRYGLPKEPTPQEMLAAGCGIVTFSGDKLLGGPQAGLIVGKHDLVMKIRKFPMKRALRLSKLPLAALEATLMLYLQPELLARDLPTLRWLTRTAEQVTARAQLLLEPFRTALAPRYTIGLETMSSQIGSGSLPVDRLPSAGLAIAPVLSGKKGTGTALDALASAMRGLPLPLIGRIADDRLLLDCRCIDDPAELLAQLDLLRERLA